MGRGPNSRGGRGRATFVQRGGRSDRGRGDGGRGGSRGGRGGDRGGRGGDCGGRGGAVVNGNGAPTSNNAVVLGVDSQRLIIELLEKLHLQDDPEMDEDDGGGAQTPMTGPELVRLLIEEEKRVFVAKSLDAALSTNMIDRRAAERAVRGRPEKVKLIIAAWHHPETTQKRVIIARSPTLSTLFTAAREYLFIKRPKAAFVYESNPAYYISDTMTIEEDTVVVVTTKLPDCSVEGLVKGGAGLNAEEAAAKNKEEAMKLDSVKQAYQARAEARTAATGKGRRQAWSEEEEASHSRLLLQEYEILQNKAEYQNMLRVRESLPIWPMRDQIVQLIEQNQCVVLSGETGSGKTTQVPQFILDSLILSGRGAKAKIMCTQPRRISAVGCAERIASERCEEVGRTIGYSIRLESKASEKTRLSFVTTGVILRTLMDDPDLTDITHLIIDEVHERDLQTDFLLVIIKDLLLRRPTLKVVLMSATLQATLFSNYFSGCPTIHVPGRTFAVRHHFLEDVKALLCKSGRGGGGAFGGSSRGGGRGGGGRNGGGREQRGRGDGTSTSSLAPKINGTEAHASFAPLLISPKAEEPIDYDIVIALLNHLVSQPGDATSSYNRSNTNIVGGAILVFMPGFAEIDELITQMSKHPVLGNPRRIQAFPLHSTLPPEAQRAVFRRMHPDVKKIVVATNIAETSITIDDISSVVDLGRAKEMRYDPATHMSSLVAVWVSQASASQRAGRAGRVREGDCYRIYTQAFMEESMPKHTLPEILRTPLEELNLTIMSLELGNPAEFLEQAIEPPSSEAISTAIKHLREIDAIRREKDPETKQITYNITPLGYHVAHLPVDVRIGKLLIIGSIMSCIEPILTIAACLSYKPPFAYPFGMQEEATLAHAKFASSGSDHIAALEAYNGFAEIRRAPYSVRKAYCTENFLSIATLEMLEKMRKQLRQNLIDIGFLPKGRRPEEEEELGRKIDINIIKCVLTAGLYPNIGKLLRPKKQGDPACFELKDKTKVFVHPGSVNFKRLNAYLLYHKKVQSAQVYVYDSTFISPFTLLLFGGSIKVEWEQGAIDGIRTLVTIDKWLTFRMTEQSAILVKYLRKEFEQALVNKISDPSIDLAQTRGIIVELVCQLLQTDKNVSGL